MAVQVRRGHAEGSGRTRAMTVCAPALLVRTAATAAAAAAMMMLAGVAQVAASSSLPNPIDEPATAEVCVDETHRWGGDVTLAAPGSVFDTGVDVPPAGGSRVSVVGVSADGLDASDRAHVLAVRVGDIPASAGATLPGGRITVANTVDASIGAVRVVGVTVVVRRCDLVASAPATPVAAASAAPAVTPASSATGAAATSSPVATGAGAAAGSTVSRAMLPATGGTPAHQSVIGAMVVALGCGLISVGRRTGASTGRRVTAGGRGPGSPLDEQRPARD